MGSFNQDYAALCGQGENPSQWLPLLVSQKIKSSTQAGVSGIVKLWRCSLRGKQISFFFCHVWWNEIEANDSGLKHCQDELQWLWCWAVYLKIINWLTFYSHSCASTYGQPLPVEQLYELACLKHDASNTPHRATSYTRGIWLILVAGHFWVTSFLGGSLRQWNRITV